MKKLKKKIAKNIQDDQLDATSSNKSLDRPSLDETPMFDAPFGMVDLIGGGEVYIIILCIFCALFEDFFN
jgi:hypothetical protein